MSGILEPILSMTWPVAGRDDCYGYSFMVKADDRTMILDCAERATEQIEQLKAENKRLTRSIGMVCRKENALKAKNDQLVNLIKLSYRNWLEDPDVAWSELGDQLCDGLCESMGDKKFQEWLKTLKDSE